eukprot:scaffold12005_cov212-Amphora_coffeaeformis.AAC.4
MAWRSSGTNNESMVDNLKRYRLQKGTKSEESNREFLGTATATATSSFCQIVLLFSPWHVFARVPSKSAGSPSTILLLLPPSRKKPCSGVDLSTWHLVNSLHTPTQQQQKKNLVPSWKNLPVVVVVAVVIESYLLSVLFIPEF